MTDPDPDPTTASAEPPLGIPYGRPETTRRLQAMSIGEQQGWWRFIPPPNPDVRPGELVYKIRLDIPGPDGKPIVRSIKADDVLLYVQAYADSRGLGHLVTYRRDL